MPSPYGAFDENGKPIRSTSNPAFTGTPAAPPVLRELPTPAPDRLFNPNAMPQLPSVQPQTPAPSLMQRAADFVMPTAGAATLDQPAAAAARPNPPAQDAPGMPQPSVGMPLVGGPAQPYDRAALYSASMDAAQARQQRAPLFPDAYDPAVMRRQLGGAIREDYAQKDARRATGYDEEARLARAAGDEEYAQRAQMTAAGLRPRHYPTAPLAGSKSAGEALSATPDLPRSGEGSRYDQSQSQTPPDIAPRTARESGPMDFPANVVPHYRTGENGALMLSMPGGGTAEFAPGAGSRDLRARVGELAGQRLGGGQYETDAQVAALRPDLYGTDGRPLLVGAFGHAVDQGLARRAAEIDARNAQAQSMRAPALSMPDTSDLEARGNALLDRAGKAKFARNQRDLSAQGQALLSLASQQQTAGRNAQLQQQQIDQHGTLAAAQDNTTRRGQDMQLLGREKRSPVSVKTADGGEVLFDPGSGQWLQPPGAQGSGIAKQDHERLKGITGHIGKAMGMDSAANPIDAATGAAYTAASRIGGGAYMATRGVRQFAGYTDADFAGIGQDVAAGRATIRTGKDGMAYAIYHGEDGKAYGVPIGPAENYANIQPAAGQPAAAR